MTGIWQAAWPDKRLLACYCAVPVSSTNRESDRVMNQSFKGYAEGYYGRLLSWSERLVILDALQEHGFNTYYYAPKEDRCHRYQWREPYSAHWRQAFRQFCSQAAERQIQVIAGIAPGIDFDFSELQTGADFQSLVQKGLQLLSDGASAVSLLMDDIDADFAKRCGSFESEGGAHAALANELAYSLQALLLKNRTPELNNTPLKDQQPSLWVTPRIYADELSAEAPAYLPDFIATLDAQHLVLYCGSDVVASNIDTDALTLAGNSPKHRAVIWDNLYANDYCPRRLFVGPWTGRDNVDDILLNPTGHVHTDCLLIALMASNSASEANSEVWWQVLKNHGVPDSFKHIAPYFNHPVCNDSKEPEWIKPSQSVFDAIEECLWRWKSPLSREWYPYLFGLKHDLLAAGNALPPIRILKTQTSALAHRLLSK